MRHFLLILLFLALAMPMSCKNKERGINTDTEPTPARAERGPDLGLPIKILDSPAENWTTIDSTKSAGGKQLSIGNVYLSRVSRVMYKMQFGYLVQGDFPDGCSTLHKVDITFENDLVLIDARSQRDPAAMCTQALVPFSYFAPVDNDDAFSAAKRWKSGDTTANID